MRCRILTATGITIEESSQLEATTPTPSHEVDYEDTFTYQQTTTRPPPPTTTTTTSTTTTTTTIPPPPPIVTIRKTAQEVPSDETYNLQLRVAAVKPSLPPVKQVLRLDYYDDDQQMEDDVEEEDEESDIIQIHPTTVASIPWGQIRPPTSRFFVIRIRAVFRAF